MSKNFKLSLLGAALWAGGVYCVTFLNQYMLGVVLVTAGVLLLEVFYHRVKDKKKE